MDAPATTSRTVFIVDDDEGVRTSLGILLDSVGYRPVAFASAREFLERYDPDQPGCLLLDIRMPDMSGMDLQRELAARAIFLPVIFITGHGDVAMAVDAMKNGAFDFLQKPFGHQELLARIGPALEADADARQTLARKEELARRHAALTPREKEVMGMIVSGHANKVIAQDLGLSERTVEIHRARVMDKMGTRSLAHLVRMALEMQR